MKINERDYYERDVDLASEKFLSASPGYKI
jgi:hypothetical protein